MRRKIEIEIDEEIISQNTEICESKIFKGNLINIIPHEDRIEYIYDALCKDEKGKIIIIGQYKLTLYGLNFL